MSNNKIVELYVYLIDNEYKFCINGESFERAEIISALKNATTQNKKECSSENLLYKFTVTIPNSGGDDTSGFAFELTLTVAENQDINTVSSNSIEITETKNKENSFIVNNKEMNCDDIFDLLQKLIEKVSISSEIDNMSDEERKATLDKMANKSDLSVSDSLQT